MYTVINIYLLFFSFYSKTFLHWFRDKKQLAVTDIGLYYMFDLREMCGRRELYLFFHFV